MAGRDGYKSKVPKFWDGKAAQRITQIIVKLGK
jgi:hypothetical protein